MYEGLLDRNSGEKLYIQLASLIRAQIQNGQIKEGQLLLTEDELCRSCGVSKAVVRQAMTELAREGYVQKRQGVGTFATKPKIVEGTPMEVVLSDKVIDFGQPLETLVIHKGPSATPSEMATLFSGRPPEQVFKVVRLRRIKGKPVLLETAYVDSTLCPGLPLDDLKNRSLFDLVENRYKLRIDQVASSFAVTHLGEREAELLKEQTGKTAILFDQILYLPGDRPLGLLRSLCPAGDYRISFQWFRKK